MAEMVYNEVGFSGETHQALAGAAYDPHVLRPYLDSQNRICVMRKVGTKMVTNVRGDKEYQPVLRKTLAQQAAMMGLGVPTTNAATTLRKEEWVQLDQVVVREARQRLRAWADLAAANSYGGFNAMGKTILEYEAMSDAGAAVVDMDGVTPGNADTPLFELRGLPLPITHCDFYFSARQLASSRQSGTPLDTTKGEMAGRRVAEVIEDTLIGTVNGITYGGANVPSYGNTPQVLGYTNYTYRNQYTSLTSPAGVGYTVSDTLTDVLAMLNVARAARFYGPFMLYHSIDYTQHMESDYILSASSGVATQTLSERIKKNTDIIDVRRLDRWDPADSYQLLLVQMTPDVCRAVNGMDITTIQWESMGGMRLNFRVMAIQVPQIRHTYGQRCGIVHGTLS